MTSTQAKMGGLRIRDMKFKYGLSTDCNRLMQDVLTWMSDGEIENYSSIIFTSNGTLQYPFADQYYY
ncbi:hypothetical protein E2C01_041621 [Portunus trituberculatus]|uniref:Uncharacterized protein n=1 Tax=Portunus trituberculatus TaxID=210409 RepID=A0A5B7FN23_PORTR|nr:hypothetical protein [Portunus trituberculatus]